MNPSDEFFFALALADLFGVCGLGCTCFLGMSIDNAFRITFLVFCLAGAFVYRRRLREFFLDEP